MKLYYATFSSFSEAQSIGEKLIQENLIQCINILGGGTSLYRWQGQLESSQEVYAYLKSSKAMADIEPRFLALHSYDTPCLIEIPVAGASAGYAKWIESDS